MFRLILMNFVNRNGSVNDRWLDGLLLHNRLDILVNVVVHMLACDGGGGRGRMLRLVDCAGIFELGLFGGETFLDVGVVAVLDVAVLDAGHLVGMFFWENLAVLDRLDGGVVVVLVDFSVDGCGGFLVSSGSYMLLLDRGVDFLRGVRSNQ
jgi:hypothetical protein